MFLALVHVTARAHAPSDQPQGGKQTVSTGQSMHERPTGIAHDLGEFDQATLRVLPSKQDDQPVLKHGPDQLGVQFTQGPPGVGRAPLVDLAVLFAEFVQQFHLPALAQQHQRLLKAQVLGWHIGDQNRPVGQPQRLLGDGLPPALGIAQEVLPPLVAHLFGHA